MDGTRVALLALQPPMLYLRSILRMSRPWSPILMQLLQPVEQLDSYISAIWRRVVTMISILQL